MAQKKRKRQPPVSLSPLEPEDALAGLMQVKPEGEDAMIKIGDQVEVLNHTNRDVVGKIGSIATIDDDYVTVSFDPPIDRQPPAIAITFIEATTHQLKKVAD